MGEFKPAARLSIGSFLNASAFIPDLKQIESKVMNRDYACLSDFIKDMTKIFDNCRYYNHRDSTFCKCSEELEAFFIQRLNTFRDVLVKS